MIWYLALWYVCFSQGSTTFSNLWAVKLKAGTDPDQVASHYRLEHLGHIVKDYFLFGDRSLVGHTLRTPINVIPLASNESVLEIVHQELLQHETKTIPMNDPLWSETWHINRSPESSKGMNILEVWKQGIFGAGILVYHIDDGVDYTHPDLRLSYRKDVSIDLVNQDNDPLSIDPTITHGTSMAGLSVGRGNNSVCGVGVAPRASLGMSKLLHKDVSSFTSAQIAQSFAMHKTVDVFVQGYGPLDTGGSFARLDLLEALAMEAVTTEGRGGKGSIVIVPPGNGGFAQDSCSFDGRVNLIQSVVINSVGEQGSMPRYIENCTGVIAGAFSSGDGSKLDRKMVTAVAGGSCTTSFSGTSSSAAVAGGVMALLLETNPELTWRDVQHVIIRGADPTGLESDVGWNRNGVGRLYSRSFGYGLMDVGKMVKLAQSWTNVPNQQSCSMQSSTRNVKIPVGQSFTHRIKIRCGNLKHAEHIILKAHVDAFKRGDIDMTLKSPMGTVSQILKGRPYDYYFRGIQDFPLKSLEFWEENPTGIWELNVSNNGDPASLISSPLTFRKWELTIYDVSAYAPDFATFNPAALPQEATPPPRTPSNVIRRPPRPLLTKSIATFAPRT
eukprot:maker-scaffold604_size126151-snap-gene-0.30 protein:Tk08224 transcript:maker-scaffold604_size126151-snap-gene-0.30-mRNA-1 annotation:"hypothetical protein DAPPUDRAFT_126713"